MSFKAEDWVCVDQDVMGDICLEVADILQDALQASGQTGSTGDMTILAGNVVACVVSRINRDAGQQMARMLPSGSEDYSTACSRATLFLEAFGPQLSSIANGHSWSAELVQRYAARKVRGQYAYTLRPVMVEVDRLIEANPPGGEWERRVGRVRIRAILPSSRYAFARLDWPKSSLTEEPTIVELACEDDGFQTVHMGETTIRTGQAIIISSWDREKREQFKAAYEAWFDLPEKDRPARPKGPPSHTIAYVRAGDGRLVYVGDRDSADRLDLLYTREHKLTLDELVRLAEAREGNHLGHPLYGHSIEPV